MERPDIRTELASTHRPWTGLTERSFGTRHHLTTAEGWAATPTETHGQTGSAITIIFYNLNQWWRCASLDAAEGGLFFRAPVDSRVCNVFSVNNDVMSINEQVPGDRSPWLTDDINHSCVVIGYWRRWNLMFLPEKIPSVIDYGYSGLSIAFQALASPLAHHNLG